jgi:hypothetical protein
MAPPRSIRTVVVAVLGLTACDRILGDEAKSDDGTEVAKTDAKKDEAKEEAKDEAKEADPTDAKVDEEEAKRLAEEAARKAEEEARKAAEAEAALPVVLSEIEVKARGAMYGGYGGGSLDITASGKLNKTIDSGTFVRAKVVCKDGDRFVADVTYLTGDTLKPLQEHAVGETAKFQGSAFTQGVKDAMAPCQVQFKLAGGGSRTLAVDLRTACYDGTTTKIGPCEPPVAAPAMSGGSAPLEVRDLNMEKHAGYGGSGGQLDATYVLQINEPQNEYSQFTLKAACEVGTARFVDIYHHGFDSSPFTYESGESIARQASLFYNPAFGFVDAPGLCDISIALWTPVTGSFGETTKRPLQQSCFREGKITPGRCDPSKPEAPAPTPVAADSLRIDAVAMQIIEPYGATGGDRFQLKLDADATVLKTVDQKVSVQAKVTCKIGSTARVETAYPYGVELYYLEPGETTKVSTHTFTSSPLEGKPRSCEAEFTAGERWAPTGAASVPLGKWCSKHSSKPAAAGVVDKVRACGGQPKAPKPGKKTTETKMPSP